jgi:hypothetical protein
MGERVRVRGKVISIPLPLIKRDYEMACSKINWLSIKGGEAPTVEVWFC